MPRISDFDKFLAEQKADKAKYGDLSERKAQWIGKIDALYGQVRMLLNPIRGLAGNRYEHGQIFANRLMDR